MADWHSNVLAQGKRSVSGTQILPVDPSRAGRIVPAPVHGIPLEEWRFELYKDGDDASHLMEAAYRLRHSNVPVAFPTETVYGLGADATRSLAVRGIYEAKQRPSDNPLIVHVCSLDQLRDLLRPEEDGSRHEQEVGDTSTQNGHACHRNDPIPPIYRPLIERFWPGPLTIILPNPIKSILAPEVTAGLDTFGARMPKTLLALALIRTAGVPLAAPSANASTRPSPTTAKHVKDDLDGRIEIIIDGGPCDVGVESTVVDGLSNPPSILRPGGISTDQLRQCQGWTDVAIGYKDEDEQNSTPKAPGMRYKHYSPRALVVLHEGGSKPPTTQDIERHIGPRRTIGVIRTSDWSMGLDLGACDSCETVQLESTADNPTVGDGTSEKLTDFSDERHLDGNHGRQSELKELASAIRTIVSIPGGGADVTLWEIALGRNTDDVARGLFAALRELDDKGVDAIFVEGIGDEGNVAAAVMNRLRKASGLRVHRSH